MAVCDHSASLKVASGLSLTDLQKKIREIQAFNQKGGPVKLLCGTEVDIDGNGNLDYPDDILRQLDIVVAAIHTGFKQDQKTLTHRITTAMHNPYVTLSPILRDA